MSATENKELALRWVDVWNRGDLGAIDGLYSSEFVYHMRFPGLAPGIEGEKQVVQMLHGAFPDLRIDVDEILVDEENAVIRWTMPATHQGVFRCIEPNGKAVRFTGIDILRIKNGRVVARWDEVNNRMAPPYV